MPPFALIACSATSVLTAILSFIPAAAVFFEFVDSSISILVEEDDQSFEVCIEVSTIVEFNFVAAIFNVARKFNLAPEASCMLLVELADPHSGHEN